MALSSKGGGQSKLLSHKAAGWAPTKAEAVHTSSDQGASALLHGEKKVALEAANAAARGLRHRDAKIVKAAAIAATAQQAAGAAAKKAEFLAGDDAADIEEAAPDKVESKALAARSKAKQAAKRNYKRFRQGRAEWRRADAAGNATAQAQNARNTRAMRNARAKAGRGNAAARGGQAAAGQARGYGMKSKKAKNAGANRGSGGTLGGNAAAAARQRSAGTPIARNPQVRRARTRAQIRRKSAAAVGQRAFSAGTSAAGAAATAQRSMASRAAHATRQMFRIGNSVVFGAASAAMTIVIAVLAVSVVFMASSGTSQSAGSLQGNEAKAAVLLKAKGFDSLHIAAILGNWTVESGCNPQQVQHGFGYCSAGDGEDSPCRHQANYPEELIDNASCGYGMAQWTWPSRARALVNFAKAKGTDSGDMATQVDFFVQGYGEAEEFSPYIDKFNAMTDLEEATTWFHNVFEASADTSMDNRVNAAKRILSALQSGGAGGEDYDSANETQKAIADMACSGAVSGDPDMCAKWVDDVYDAAIRGSVQRYACANEAARAGIQSTDRNVPVGAQVYSMHSYGPVYHGDHDACHIGIYVGGGKIASNEGGAITYKTFDEWDAVYGWRGWGWPGGVRPW